MDKEENTEGIIHIINTIKLLGETHKEAAGEEEEEAERFVDQDWGGISGSPFPEKKLLKLSKYMFKNILRGQ